MFAMCPVARLAAQVCLGPKGHSSLILASSEGQRLEPWYCWRSVLLENTYTLRRALTLGVCLLLVFHALICQPSLVPPAEGARHSAWLSHRVLELSSFNLLAIVQSTRRGVVPSRRRSPQASFAHPPALCGLVPLGLLVAERDQRSQPVAAPTWREQENMMMMMISGTPTSRDVSFSIVSLCESGPDRCRLAGKSPANRRNGPELRFCPRRRKSNQDGGLSWGESRLETRLWTCPHLVCVTVARPSLARDLIPSPAIN